MTINTSRMLPASTEWHSLESIGLYRPSFCYVLGCYALAIQTARHQQFGPVACCAGHPVTDFVPTVASAEIVEAEASSGGAKVPRNPLPKVNPPSNAVNQMRF
jgi:hypothetical protein